MSITPDPWNCGIDCEPLKVTINHCYSLWIPVSHNFNKSLFDTPFGSFWVCRVTRDRRRWIRFFPTQLAKLTCSMEFFFFFWWLHHHLWYYSWLSHHLSPFSMVKSPSSHHHLSSFSMVKSPSSHHDFAQKINVHNFWFDGFKLNHLTIFDA